MSVVIEISILSILSICWLTFHGRVTRRQGQELYHVLVAKRDASRAKFYYYSVWVGIIAVFLAARCLEAVTSIHLDSVVEQLWTLGVLRGVEMWGICTIGGVWLIVGQRVSRPNSDGMSLIPDTADMNEPVQRDSNDKRRY